MSGDFVILPAGEVSEAADSFPGSFAGAGLDDAGCPKENGEGNAAGATGVGLSFEARRGELEKKLRTDGALFSFGAAGVVLAAVGVAKKLGGALAFSAGGAKSEGPSSFDFAIADACSTEVAGFGAIVVSIQGEVALLAGAVDFAKVKGRDCRGGSFSPSRSCSTTFIWEG